MASSFFAPISMNNLSAFTYILTWGRRTESTDSQNITTIFPASFVECGHWGEQPCILLNYSIASKGHGYVSESAWVRFPIIAQNPNASLNMEDIRLQNTSYGENGSCLRYGPLHLIQGSPTFEGSGLLFLHPIACRRKFSPQIYIAGSIILLSMLFIAWCPWYFRSMRCGRWSVLWVIHYRISVLMLQY